MLGRGEPDDHLDVLERVGDHRADHLVKFLAFKQLGQLGWHVNLGVELRVDLHALDAYDIEFLAWDEEVLNCLAKDRSLIQVKLLPDKAGVAKFIWLLMLKEAAGSGVFFVHKQHVN